MSLNNQDTVQQVELQPQYWQSQDDNNSSGQPSAK